MGKPYKRTKDTYKITENPSFPIILDEPEWVKVLYTFVGVAVPILVCKGLDKIFGKTIKIGSHI